jgi:predicted AAA+ superfamily ATPase
MFNRKVNIPKNNSFFLFGARGTGKSTLLRQKFSEARWIDLLDVEMERRLRERPSVLKELLAAGLKSNWVVIDEIQKVPELLNTVHSLIESSHLNFVLTGSSARKLKRGGANLLAGRAFMRRLYPLTHDELGSSFSIEDVLNWGALPKIFQFDEQRDRMDFLKAYADTYLREEIVMEQLVRKVPAFRKFLEVSAQSAGKILNYAKIAKDIGSDPVTVPSYFEILEDTLVATLLPPYHSSIRKRQRKNPKLYFFDLGVQRALALQLDIPVREGTYLYGNNFEQFLITEIQRLAEYTGKNWSFSYLRTKDDAEIDLIIERPGMPTAAIEIKSSRIVDEKDVDAFARLAGSLQNAEMFFLSQDPLVRKIGLVTCMPWQEGIAALDLRLS